MGIIVGANGITVDLDGHIIDGIGIDAGVEHRLRRRHDQERQHQRVRLRRAAQPRVAQDLVTGMRVETNQEAGIALADADEGGFGNTIRDNTVVMNKLGIALYSNTRYTIVRDNHVGGNQDDGVRLEMAHQNQIFDERDRRLVRLRRLRLRRSRQRRPRQPARRQPRRRRRRRGAHPAERTSSRTTRSWTATTTASSSSTRRRHAGSTSSATAAPASSWSWRGRARQGQRPERERDGRRRRGVDRRHDRRQQRERRSRLRYRGRLAARRRRA